MKKEIGYKIVFVVSLSNKKNFISCWATTYEVEYKINKWVRRQKGLGALAVFDTLENAKHFFWTSNIRTSSCVIFKCKYKESKLNYLFDECFHKHLDVLPKGTCFADEVMLLEEVKVDRKNSKQ